MSLSRHPRVGGDPVSSNSESLITEHIDLWTSSIKARKTQGRGSSKKRELYGIKKLRELILELAVRGKLVPQDSNDEPASELLKRIAAEKELLLKDGIIKKQKTLPEISDEEKLFDLPVGWSFCHLRDIMNVLNGRAYKKHEMLETGTPLLRVGNLFTSKEWYYSDIELEPNKYIDNGDLIYAWSASFGPFIWDAGKVIYHYHIWKLDQYHEPSTNKFYLLNYLQAITASIKASGNGIAMIHMTKERMEKLVLPIAPLSEQHRIVAKVDELMALCDQLEQQTETSLDAHKLLVDTLLASLLKPAEGSLTDARDATELSDNWARLADHFDTLITTDYAVEQLKQTILQLAVMGKLVPQDPSDEPASELLKRIAVEKEQLIKDKKIKKQKPLPLISEEDLPFELPGGWEWCRLGECINLISGQHLKPDEYSEASIGDDIPYITGPAEFGPVHPTYSKYTKEKRALANAGDILITCKGSGIGKINSANKTIAISRQLMAIQPITILNDYVKLVVDSRYEYFQSKGVGIAIPGISREDVTEMVFAAPSKQVQRSIVTKVDELMTLCEKLKVNLDDAKTTQLHLADAVVELAL
jgi:type I restriction enzyme S subunit